MGEIKTLLRLAVLALMWGSSFIWIKVGLHAFSPIQLVLARLVLGAAVLLVLCYTYRAKLPSSRRVWTHLAVAAFFHNALPFTLFAVGEQTVDAGTTGVINATTPLWAMAAALLWRIERRPNLAKLSGLLLGFAGVLVIFAPWQADGLLSWGAAACLGAAVSYGFIFVYEGKFLSNLGISPFALAGAQMLTASGFVLLAMPVGGLSPIQLNTASIIAVSVLGLVSTGIAFALNYRLLSTEGAVTTSTVGYLIPVVSIVLGAVFLGEQVNLRIVAGLVVVLVGVALTRVGPRARVEEEPTQTREPEPTV